MTFTKGRKCPKTRIVNLTLPKRKYVRTSDWNTRICKVGFESRYFQSTISLSVRLLRWQSWKLSRSASSNYQKLPKAMLGSIFDFFPIFSISHFVKSIALCSKYILNKTRCEIFFFISGIGKINAQTSFCPKSCKVSLSQKVCGDML